MPTKDIKPGDRVMFTQAALKRAAHDARVADMRGTVLSLLSGGAVARVDCGDTWTSDEGRTVRAIPVANLIRVGSPLVD